MLELQDTTPGWAVSWKSRCGRDDDHGFVDRRTLARPVVRHEIDRRRVRAAGERVPELGHGGRFVGLQSRTGRYHLYVSLACPWAHRTLIFRKLKKLEDAITVSVVEPLMLENGWDFVAPRRPITVNGALPLSGLYRGRTRLSPAASPCRCCGTSSSGRSSTTIGRDHPDAELGVRRLRRRLAGLLPGSSARGDRRDQRLVYDRVNNGVYKAGSPPIRGSMNRPSTGCSRRSIRWRSGLGGSASWSATGRPRPTGGSSPRWCASTRSMSGTSSATGSASRIIRTCRTICATCTRPRCGRDGEPGSHQAALLRQSQDHQPDRHRAQGTGARLRRSP